MASKSLRQKGAQRGIRLVLLESLIWPACPGNPETVLAVPFFGGFHIRNSVIFKELEAEAGIEPAIRFRNREKWRFLGSCDIGKHL